MLPKATRLPCPADLIAGFVLVSPAQPFLAPWLCSTARRDQGTSIRSAGTLDPTQADPQAPRQVIHHGLLMSSADRTETSEIRNCMAGRRNYPIKPEERQVRH